MLVKEQPLVRAGRRHDLDRHPQRMGSVRPRIGLISDGDPTRPGTMSGTPYYCAQGLRNYCGDLVLLSCGYRWLERAIRLGNGAAERVTRRRYSRAHSLALARLRSRDFARQARQSRCDIIFSAKDCKGIAYFPRQIPVIYWSDATFKSMLGYYPSFSSLYNFSRREGEYLERRALNRADAIIMLSSWAAASAIRDYGISPRKVSSFSFGPKLDPAESLEKVREFKTFKNGLRLLWVGTNWERKGGPMALQVVELLRERGIPAELTIIGSSPRVSSPALRVIPHLEKSVPAELAQLREEYCRAHFFLLPTRQEAGGSVFLEATGFGLPSIACRTGGVGSIVRHNVNGFTLPVESPASAYADIIQEHYREPALYTDLVTRTWDFHQRVANWEIWGERVSEIINRLLTVPTSPSHSRL